MDLQCHYTPLFCFLFQLLAVSEGSEKTVSGFVGKDVILPCRYDASYHGQLAICWGRGEIPSRGCNNEILSSDGTQVTGRTSQRYQLGSGLTEGDVSLTILNAQESDAGTYGCRVHIPGMFNDEKNTVKLTLIKSPVTTKAPESTSSTAHQAASGTWTTLKHTQDAGLEEANTTASSNTTIPMNSNGAELEGHHLAVLLLVMLLLLLAITFLILMRKRWKKAGELVGISPQLHTGVHYRNSESSQGLHSREIAVENIYQLDERDDYETCP
ncbi:hypothetical protein AGOR_G00022640 [Albula goreensis]|uniref:Ig-like domain-containing protein n=1 Tax=Albula goreensis TaxID=1534307 RepID=A0A8T3E5S1_9TELE|nr:hypothetical protein AGOR_G00022640 [Albula goreensis]